MAALTFLFTDIEGSTRLWDLHPEAMRTALEDHDELIRAVHAIEDSGMALDWTLTALRDRTHQRARSELGEAAAEAAFEAGRRLGLDGAIALVTAV